MASCLRTPRLLLLAGLCLFVPQPAMAQYYCNGRAAITQQWGGCNGTEAVCSSLMAAITQTWNWWATVNNTPGNSVGVAVHNFFTTDAYGELLSITNNNTAYPTACTKIAKIVAQLLIWNATKDANVILGNATYAASARQEMFNSVIPGWGYTIGQYIACGSTCTNYTSSTSTTTTGTTSTGRGTSVASVTAASRTSGSGTSVASSNITPSTIGSGTPSITSSTTMMTPSTKQCKATLPANTVGLVQDATAEEGTDSGDASETFPACNCSSANATLYAYPPNSGNTIWNRPHGPTLVCDNISQLCVCDEQRNCYNTYGEVSAIIIVPYCDAGGCHMYTSVACAIQGDSGSGLQNIVTGEKFPCSAEYNSLIGSFYDYGTGSPYTIACCNSQLPRLPELFHPV